MSSSVEHFLTYAIYNKGEHPSHPSWDKYVYDDENVHYALLKILLENCPKFTGVLLKREIPSADIRVSLKPDKGIFDMFAEFGGERFYFEIKIWATLTEGQFTRQVEYIKSKDVTAYYILFTKAADSWSNGAIERRSDGYCRLVGTDDLLEALESANPCSPPEVTEIAHAYKAVIKHMQNRW